MTNDTIKSDTIKPAPMFDQPVILERRPYWASVVVLTIIGMTVFGVGWAAWAEIDQSIASAGKLEPKGGGVEVKAPTGGVVREIHVKGGDVVKENDLLITFDPTAPEADVDSLRELRESLMRENQFYNAAIAGNPVTGATPELQTLVKLRSDLRSENQFLEASISGVDTLGGRGAFDVNQEQLLRASRSEYDTRVAAASFQVQELRSQLRQVQEQIPSGQRQLAIAREQETTARSSLETARQQVPTVQSRLETARLQIPTAQARLETARRQIPTAQARIETARLQIPTAQARLETARRQIPTAQARLETARRQIPTAQARIETARLHIPGTQARIETARRQIPTAQAQLETALDALALQEGILSQIDPLVGEGALSQLQAQRQEQEVLTRESEVSSREADLLTRTNEISGLEGELLNRQNEVSALESELLNRQNEVSALESEVLNRQNEVSGLESELLNRQNEVSGLEAEVLNRQSEVSSLETEVLNRQNEILGRQAELDRRRDEVLAREAELTRLSNEADRLESAISRSEQQLENTQFASQKDVRTRIAENQKRISEIESQFSRSLLENKQRISQIDGQLARAQLQLQYQELRAPVAGEVFDLEPNAPGFVARESEPLLKLVRDAKLEASVLIQNQDIALVLDALRKNKEEGKKGVPVEVMVEAFPATEFGTVNGILTSIGSDVLEPDPQTGRNFYAFPATIELDSNKFILENGLQVNLHSGMAVQTKIKIGRRTVLQLFLSRLTNQTKGLETVK